MRHKEMKILITGNMGYIGPCVVDHLRQSYPKAELIGYQNVKKKKSCRRNARI